MINAQTVMSQSVMHTLLIRSRTLCMRYSNARTRYVYVIHTLWIRYLYTGIRYMHTLLIRYHDGPSSIARV